MNIENLNKLQLLQENIEKIKTAFKILECYLNGGDIVVIENKLIIDLPEDRVLISKVANVLYKRLVELEKEFDEL